MSIYELIGWIVIVWFIVGVVVLCIAVHFVTRKPKPRKVVRCKDCSFLGISCDNPKSDYCGVAGTRLKEMGNWCDKGKAKAKGTE